VGLFITEAQLDQAILELRKKGPVVFTNGCFDLLHVGHVRYLKEARSLGASLIVGVNSDASVRKLKGLERPIQCESDRAEILASLECVSLSILFSEDTPESLIKRIRPDILVKGGDWKIEEILGGSFVQSTGGRVLSLQFIDGKSTTQLIKKSQSAPSASSTITPVTTKP
jgi:rfaE bifunctional protein nucleotidyltransferase chain/domain